MSTATDLKANEMSSAEDPMNSAVAFLVEAVEGICGDNLLHGEEGWDLKGFTIGEDGRDGGKKRMHSMPGAAAFAMRKDIPVTGTIPHLMTFEVESTGPLSLTLGYPDAIARWGKNDWATVPSTHGKPLQFRYYFRPTEGATVASLKIEGGAVSAAKASATLRNPIIRRIKEAEFSDAYQRWRMRFPERNLSPRPDDGRHLLQSIRKLRDGLDPDQPFLIWAIGSSYTNMLGMGETLRQIIRQRFPNAPKILYRKHVGSSVTWDYITGWYRHQVNADQPDLILIYTIGEPVDLDSLLTEIRSTSTADIIVPSIHWRMGDAALWGKSEDAREQVVGEIRAVCQKHDVEFVENRREWAAYMQKHGYKLAVDAQRGLLKDNVHQSDYGALVINENIARHFNPDAIAGESDPPKERRIPLAGRRDRQADVLTLAGDWIADAGIGMRAGGSASAMLKFNGNRVDLIGRRTGETGGTLTIRIDGLPADKAGAFFLTAIEPGKNNHVPYNQGLSGDVAPHGVVLGVNPVPQDWTITLLDDTGNYVLEGGITGPDGTGHVLADFVGTSGQIKVPARLWRNPKVAHNGEEYGLFSNRKGDRFSFEVFSASVGEVSFRGPESERFRVILATNLENGPHVVEALAQGDGPVDVTAFDVFQPPLIPKENKCQHRGHA